MKYAPLGLLPALLPASALAHGVSPAISGFYAGGLLILAGPEDLLQWLALGAVAAVNPPERAGWAAEALTAGMLLGFAVSSTGWGVSVPPWTAAAGLLIIGTLLVAHVRCSLPALLLLALGIGVTHGIHLGMDLTDAPGNLVVAAGIGIVIYVVMTVCIATLIWLSRQISAVSTTAFRALGSWVVAIALMLGAFEFAVH